VESLRIQEKTPLNAISLCERDLPNEAADATASSPAGWTDDDVDDLRLAILVDAIRRFFDPRVRLDHLCEELAWITDDGPEPFGFQACAVAAAADPGKLRSLILDMKRRGWRPSHLHLPGNSGRESATGVFSERK
jgi:hypothetical protein